MSDRTLLLVKPDAVRRGLVGEVLRRVEAKGLRITALQMRVLERETAEQHYAEHEGKGFYAELVDFITGGPLVAVAVEGERVVEALRQVMGSTDPVGAAPGSIRGDLGTFVGQNLVHGSDSPESAARELGLFFPDLAPA